MTNDVIFSLENLEAQHLQALSRQFLDLLLTASPSNDAAVARLVPSAYEEDPEAERDFRRATEADLLARRAGDTQRVLDSLGELGDAEDERVEIRLDSESVESWMRTLTALRLVLAEKLGITSATGYDTDDPRFAVYEWLAYRLEALIIESERTPDEN